MSEKGANNSNQWAGYAASAPQARGAEPPLDNMGSKVSPWREKAAIRAAERRQLREVARKLLPNEAVARCYRYVGRNVEIAGQFGVPVYRGEHGSYFSNIVTCGSIWHCPVCAAKLAEERRLYVAHAVDSLHADGGTVFMITLTQGHKGFEEPKPMRQALSNRWRRILGGKKWIEIREKCGLLGFCRALEVTHGKFGWHPHLHVLVFFEKMADSQDFYVVLNWIIARWVKFTIADGYECSEAAQNIRLANTGKVAGDYMGKFGVDWEMTHAHIKRGKSGRTSFQILADYASDGWVPDAQLFKIHAKAFKGARQLTWSGKIRTLYPIPIEKVSKSLFWKSNASNIVCTIREDLWREIDRVGARELVLDACDEFGFEGVLWAVQSKGLAIAGVFPKDEDLGNQ